MKPPKWGAKPKRNKRKRGDWDKPKKRTRKAAFGAPPKLKKKDKQWGREPKEKGGGLFRESGHRSGGILGKLFRQRGGPTIRDYYRQVDKLQRSEVTSEVNAKLGEIDEQATERTTNRLTQVIEALTNKRLSSGQVEELKRFAKSTNTQAGRDIAGVLNDIGGADGGGGNILTRSLQQFGKLSGGNKNILGQVAGLLGDIFGK